LQSAWYQKTLEAEIAEWNRLNIGGTPSVYLNDVALKFTSVPDFFSMLDAVIQKESTKGKK
jgi:protein-disulfide isomerase